MNLAFAVAALDSILAWRPEPIARPRAGLTAAIATGARARGLAVPPDRHRALHRLGLRGPRPFGPDDVAALAERAVHVSARGGALRVSLHLWCSEADVERPLAALDQLPR